jgi:hypothetical protein
MCIYTSIFVFIFIHMHVCACVFTYVQTRTHDTCTHTHTQQQQQAELACDAECRDIAHDTITKCEKDFGRVVCLIICRPGVIAEDSGEETGRGKGRE